MSYYNNDSGRIDNNNNYNNVYTTFIMHVMQYNLYI